MMDDDASPFALPSLEKDNAKRNDVNGEFED